MIKQLHQSVFSLIIISIGMFISCNRQVEIGTYNIIPFPQEVELTEDEGFLLRSSTSIYYPEGDEMLKRTAGFLAEYIRLSTGMKLTVTDNLRTKDIIIIKTSGADTNNDSYRLTVNADQVCIEGAGASGTFYGVQTLRKALPVESGNKDILLPAVTISDYPRFAYRGMMLDIARHCFPLDFIKQYIDILALHNINVFHWHLTDDQGWRIEIKQYPELTSVGSIRKETLIGHLNSLPNLFDNTPYGGFYTQEEAREIVAYAADRFITVIPEVDLPGHMLAAMTAYPGLGCTGGPYEVGTKWGVFEDVLCVGKESTFTFLENVLTELLDIFPAPYIHIGGDECPKTRWEVCPACQARIKELGITGDSEHTKEQLLQSYCMSRVERFLNGKGRSIIGWDEILEGEVAPNATIMSWRGIAGGVKAARLQHPVIMVPYTHLYFDYNQGPDKDKEPLSIGGYVPVEKVYNFEPVPAELTDEEKKYIIGVQGNMWTEYLTETSLVEYMLMPRIDALSEIQWSEPQKKDYASFLKRLQRMMKLYDRLGYNYAQHVKEKSFE